MNITEAYEYLAPKLSLSEREVLDVIYKKAVVDKPQLCDVRDILNNIPDVYKVGRNDWAFANVGIISDGYKTRQEAEIAARDAIIEAARAVAHVV